MLTLVEMEGFLKRIGNIETYKGAIGGSFFHILYLKLVKLLCQNEIRSLVSAKLTIVS
jgi:hypothetical protein